MPLLWHGIAVLIVNKIFGGVGQKGFWAGVAMAAPFYAEFIPWVWAMVLIIPLLCSVILHAEPLRKPHWVLLPMGVLLLLHVMALVFSDTPFQFQVLKDTCIAMCLLAIYFFADEIAVDGFFSAVIPIAIISAVLGLLKAALLDRGYLIGYLLHGCYYYPAGSALCVNYNNLGLLWLVAALGCMRKRWWLFIPILVAAGLLSSSRRFLILMLFLPVVWMSAQGRISIYRSLLAALMAFALVHLVSDPESFERFRFGDEPYKVIFDIENSQSKSAATGQQPTVNRSVPSAMLETMADRTVGAASRYSYWELGMRQIGWWPKGWAYHGIFACRFSACNVFNYPHLSIVSESIIGGAVFGIVAVMFYILPAWLIWRRGSLWSLALIMMAMPYSLISGDTVFSLPIYLSCMLVALGSLPRKFWLKVKE